MANHIETFDLNVHMHQGFDYDDVHLKLGNLTKDSRLVINLILMPNEQSTFESIAMPSDLDEKVKIAWQVLKVQFILNQKAQILHYKLSLPYNFFVVNVGNKPYPILPQIMCCVIYHYVYLS